MLGAANVRFPPKPPRLQVTGSRTLRLGQLQTALFTIVTVGVSITSLTQRVNQRPDLGDIGICMASPYPKAQRPLK